MRSVFDTAGEYVEDARKNAIITAFRRRLEYLEQIAGNRNQIGSRQMFSMPLGSLLAEIKIKQKI